VADLVTKHAGEVGTEGMREIGEHRSDVPERHDLVGGVDPLGELVQSQPTVTARGLQDFDHAFTVLV
jgi:hypothetical protein